MGGAGRSALQVPLHTCPWQGSVSGSVRVTLNPDALGHGLPGPTQRACLSPGTPVRTGKISHLVTYSCFGISDGKLSVILLLAENSKAALIAGECRPWFQGPAVPCTAVPAKPRAKEDYTKLYQVTLKTACEVEWIVARNWFANWLWGSVSLDTENLLWRLRGLSSSQPDPARGSHSCRRAETDEPTSQKGQDNVASLFHFLRISHAAAAFLWDRCMDWRRCGKLLLLVPRGSWTGSRQLCPQVCKCT